MKRKEIITKRWLGRFFLLLVILLPVTWFLAYTRNCNSGITGPDAVQIVLVGPSVASGLTKVQEPSHCYSYLTSEIRGCVGSNAVEEFPFRLYVTPEDKTVEALAAQLNGAKDAYKVAVQWTYVSEQKLNHIADKWLTPKEFFANTPHYPSNPLKGKEVSDCEEQAHALVSLIRAEGIPPEEVRVALGEIKLGDVETGHAWVELLSNGRWVALDPSCGPYWDDKAGKLVRRRGVPFDYYASHSYPVLQI